MEAVKYFYQAYANNEQEESKQGYAEITLISASSQSALTDHLIEESIKGGKKVKIDYANKSLEINKKHCPTVKNVTDPLTGQIYAELAIEEVYKMGQLRELYEELSNAVGDINQLKQGIKKK